MNAASDYFPCVEEDYEQQERIKEKVMKKLLVLVLVLSMASVASATLQISIDGDPNPIDTEIYLDESDTLILDIWTNADIGPFGGEDWMLVCDAQLATISGGVTTVIADVANDILGLAPGAEGVLPPAGQEGIAGFLANLGFDTVPAGTKLVDDIEFHCEVGDPPNDVVVSLYHMVSGQVPGPGDLLDQVVIHQIPEPMTMLLLGLGGVGLLRRR
jgi:hypothetical protein